MDKLRRLTGFAPFILIIFLNAFVDLGHKILIQNTVFKVYDGQTQIILTAIVNGLILLPFILLFSPAGYLADRFRKPLVMRYSAAVAIGLTLLITLSYYLGWFWFSFVMTFLLAIQSAIYSPAKYGYIKELAGNERLATANAAVQAVTIIAILTGVFIFSMLFEQGLADVDYTSKGELLQAIAPLGWVLVACALMEWFFTLTLPDHHEPAVAERFELQRYRSGDYLHSNLQRILSNRTIWLSIVGLSVFWGISQVVMAAFPAFAKEVLSETNTVVIQGILACSGIGIMIGSLIAGKASRHHIETGLVPLGALGVVASLFFLPQLSSPTLLALDSFLLGLSGGLFIIPLNALIQFHARDEELGTILAGNNWVQNLVMLSFLGLTVLFAVTGTSSLGLFHLLTLTALGGAIYTLYQLPQSLVRYLIGRIFAGRYRIHVMGFDNLPGQGGVLMLGNHISWLDWAMIQIACPRPVRFVMHKAIYQRWYLRWFLDFFGVIPIAPGDSKGSLEKINTLLKSGEVVCLFPEGAISHSGQLGEFKRGYERTVEDVEGVILPFYLRGLWGSRFSRSSERMREIRSHGGRRDIIVAFGKPLPIDTRTDELKRAVFDLSIDTWDRHTDSLDPLPLAWIRRVGRQGGSDCMADAKGRETLSGRKALTASIAISRLMRQRSPEQNIGLLLPTSSAGLITNMAALLLGKTLVNLNYTASLQALLSAIDQAEISSLYTSRRFIQQLERRGVDLTQLLECCRVHYLEELNEQIGHFTKLTLFTSTLLLPARLILALYGKRVDIDQAAAILFSSGSEGAPKGVVLSHRNMMANIKQVSDLLDSRRSDKMMATLPLFHAFGLTITGLLPLIEGMPVICHPDPTDAPTIAKAIARHRATIFCATSTFLGLFTRNRRVHPLMLESLRLVVAGAERLNPNVRDTFKLKFNKEIYEGYGTTETTPVASVNIPDRINPRDWQVQLGSRAGTVGLPLPGGSFRIVDPETLESLPTGEDGLILFGGVQIMLGYLKNPEGTGEAVIELGGRRWYKTGDKGHIDQDGFLTIVDRYSRFAKIGGEMISLSAVESAISGVIPESVEVAATTLPNEKKGESVALLFAGDIEQTEIKGKINEAGLPPLMTPSRLIKVNAIPKLGSGKTDFKQVKEMAMEAEEHQNKS
ncbi:MAG: acyl-[ACP]--phospholipid O-acyltransferase [Candidatus Sedimenticola sp. (ex Thyasira tokunagai)]